MREIEKITFVSYGIRDNFSIEIKKKKLGEYRNIDGKVYYNFSIKHNISQISGFVNYYFDRTAISKNLKAYFLNENRSYEIKEKDEGLKL